MEYKLVRKVLLVILVMALSACGMKTGSDALALMNQGRKDTVEIMHGLTMSTTISDIKKILGDPSDMGISDLNPTWELLHEGKTTHLRAYFLTHQLNKVQYMSLDPMWGYTTYYDENGVRVGT